jgi:DNA processing protein
MSILNLNHPKYPKILKEIYNPPKVLYFLGNPDILEGINLAVVGTRKPTTYGRQTVFEIVSGLVQNGITIVSGLALGIDALAHQACLETGGKTIAVLGSGLDMIYPNANYFLAQKILKNNGCIISEYPEGTEPQKYHFPQRNRIISGLSLGTLIVEAPLDSGALITGKYALDQNREVFAIPGSIYSENSAGPNNLIKMGAKAVTEAKDILETLNIQMVENFMANQKIIADSREEEILLKFLSKEPQHIDKIIEESKLKPSIVNSTLTLMEMKGKVKNLGGMNYVLGR